MSDPRKFQLTAEDIARYEEMISNVDLSEKGDVLKRIPKKLNTLIQAKELYEYQVQLIEDVTKLYTLMNTIPDLSNDVQKRVLFALNYFEKSDDEIPDGMPDLGYLDDAVIVRWVLDHIVRKYTEYFDA